jgi:hypothetical protein
MAAFMRTAIGCLFGHVGVAVFAFERHQRLKRHVPVDLGPFKKDAPPKPRASHESIKDLSLSSSKERESNRSHEASARKKRAAAQPKQETANTRTQASAQARRRSPRTGPRNNAAKMYARKTHAEVPV